MLRYKFPMIAGGVVILIGIIVYFAWIGPEDTHLSALDKTKAGLVARERVLEADIASLRLMSRNFNVNCSKLGTRIAQLPPSADEGQFLSQVDTVAGVSGSTVTGYSFSLPTISTSPFTSGSAAPKAFLPSVTVTLDLSGSYSQLTAFLLKLDSLSRLYTVTAYNLSIPATSGVTASSGVLPSAGTTYTLELTGSIYYNPNEKDVCSSSAAG